MVYYCLGPRRRSSRPTLVHRRGIDRRSTNFLKYGAPRALGWQITGLRSAGRSTTASARGPSSRPGSSASSARRSRWAWPRVRTAAGGSVVVCPPPLNVLKDTNDRSCYWARSDEYQRLMTDSPAARHVHRLRACDIPDGVRRRHRSPWAPRSSCLKVTAMPARLVRESLRNDSE
jgi:hypothetical protein